jgi:transaldolase
MMVKIFIDSADIEEIKKVKSYGILDGVTTNPSLIKKASDKHKENLDKYLKEILKVCKGKSVSLEVIGNTYREMVLEGEKLFKKFNRVAGNVYIKIPVNPCLDKMCKNGFDGIRAIKTLSKKKIPVNCTLIFTPEQALLAAKAGAKFVSPFVGRENDYIRKKNKIKFENSDYFPREGLRKKGKILEDEGIVSGINLVERCREIFDEEKIKCKILAASIRNKEEFREAVLAGADIVTMPMNTIESLISHFKTREGMVNFTKDVIPEYKKLVEGNGKKNRRTKK